MFKQLNYIFSSKDRWKISFLMVMIIIGSFFDLIGVTIFTPYIEIIMDPSVIQETPVLKYFNDLFQFSRVEDFLLFLSAVIIAVYVIKNIFLWIEQDLILRFSYNRSEEHTSELQSPS